MNGDNELGSIRNYEKQPFSGGMKVEQSRNVNSFNMKGISTLS